MQKISVASKRREEMLNITAQVQNSISSVNWKHGVVVIFCPHTTCGVTINEGADPDVTKDMIRFFSSLIPRQTDWHHAEGNSDAHIKSSILGASVMVPVEDGALKLGTWQSIYLYEGDGPRMRSLWLQWLPGEHKPNV